MLLGLHFKPAYPRADREELGIALAELVGSRTRVFESRNLQEYVDTLKAYRPSGRDNLVLINTHYDFNDELSIGHWRATDMLFNQKGGVVFGEDAPRDSTSHRNKIVYDNPQFMVDSAAFYEGKANNLKKEAVGYFGRCDSDPHTVVFGFTPSWPKLSISAEALLAGLPDEWWQGVGFYNRRNKDGKAPEDSYRAIADKFYFSSYVAASQTAADILNSLDIPHQRADDIRFKTLPEAQNYGKALRKLSRLDSERIVE